MVADEYRWEYAGRYYVPTAFSDTFRRDGYGLELEDVAPMPNKGIVLEVFKDDTDGTFTFQSFTSDPLPLELVQRFIAYAREVIGE